MGLDEEVQIAGRRASDAQVVYSVRELLDKIRKEQTEGFARMDTLLSTKADKGDVARLEAQYNRLDSRVTVVERRVEDDELKSHTQEEEHDRTWSLGKKVLAGVMTFVGLGMTVLGPYIGTHV